MHTADGTGLEFDPDQQAQAVVRLIFAEYTRQGTVYGLLRYLKKHEIRIPVRPISGPMCGQLEWRRPVRATLLSLLHHPAYAGAYRYGYRHSDPRKKIAGRSGSGIVRIPLEDQGNRMKFKHL